MQELSRRFFFDKKHRRAITINADSAESLDDPRDWDFVVSICGELPIHRVLAYLRRTPVRTRPGLSP